MDDKATTPLDIADKVQKSLDRIAHSFDVVRRDEMLKGFPPQATCDFDDVMIAFWELHKRCLAFNNAYLPKPKSGST